MRFLEQLFENLFDSVDLIPPLLIEAAEAHRAAEPELFEKLLEHAIDAVRLNGSPSSATEFVTVLATTSDQSSEATPTGRGPSQLTF